jgi:formylglycine-generating enzyme required for sulfatase activity
VGFDDERPMRKRHVDAFEIDVHEVTAADYAACMRGAACTAAASGPFCNAGMMDHQDHPINCVNHAQAEAFCKWAGKRLPTEEQWEYAARGSQGRTYPWGEVPPTQELACWKRGPEGQRFVVAGSIGTCSVTGRSLAHGPFGAADMAGNVAEWTATHYTRNYGEPESPNAPFVVRGGSFIDHNSLSLRNAARIPQDASTADRTIGFRCVR